VTIGAGNTLTWKDVLVSLFGFGQGASVSGTIVITSSQDLEIISRTYNETNLGAVNLGATAVDLRITLFDTYGSRLGSPLGLTLGAHQWKQIGNILDAVGGLGRRQRQRRPDDRSGFASVGIATNRSEDGPPGFSRPRGPGSVRPAIPGPAGVSAHEDRGSGTR